MPNIENTYNLHRDVTVVINSSQINMSLLPVAQVLEPLDVLYGGRKKA